jgi:8-oxo-dGTP pyrophosphatase MutT (NUDIX family)
VIEQTSTRQVYANNWMTVREDGIRLSDGTEGIYGVVDKPTYALVVPRDDAGRLHLVEQFRYPVGERRWEFPAGTAPDRADQDPAELAEETGLAAASMTLLGTLDCAPGMSSQRGHVYLATGLTAGPPRREHQEQDMRAAWFTPDEFVRMTLGGRLTDAQTLAAYALLRLHDERGAAGA